MKNSSVPDEIKSIISSHKSSNFVILKININNNDKDEKSPIEIFASKIKEHKITGNIFNCEFSVKNSGKDEKDSENKINSNNKNKKEEMNEIQFYLTNFTEFIGFDSFVIINNENEIKVINELLVKFKFPEILNKRIRILNDMVSLLNKIKIKNANIKCSKDLIRYYKISYEPENKNYNNNMLDVLIDSKLFLKIVEEYKNIVSENNNIINNIKLDLKIKNKKEEEKNEPIVIKLHKNNNNNIPAKAFIGITSDKYLKQFYYGAILKYDDKYEEFKGIVQKEKYNAMKSTGAEIFIAKNIIKKALHLKLKNLTIYSTGTSLKNFFENNWIPSKIKTESFCDFINKIKNLINLNFIKVEKDFIEIINAKKLATEALLEKH